MAAAATIPRRTSLPSGARHGWILVAAAACVALAALSLLVSRQPTYDPTAWLIWGREILHGNLSTTSGPSWKPLPMLVTTPSAVLDNGGQQAVWLVVARVGMLAAVALAYRLAWRLEGPVAGVVAAFALLVSSGYTSRTFRGDSEGLLVALALGAVESHVSGRRWLAFTLLVATALLRPEMWLFAGLYGLWLVLVAEPRFRRPRAAAIVVGVGVVVVAAWLIPEEIGSGQLLRAASRALEPVAGSPATASVPFVATFTNAAPVLPWPLYAAGVVCVALALRPGRRPERWLTLTLASVATALMVIVAVMAEMGFTGNSRYLTIPIALTGVLGGAGLVGIASIARSRLPGGPGAVAIGLVAAVSLVAFAHAASRTRAQFQSGEHEAAYYARLPAAIASVGGARGVLGCREIYTEWFDVPAVARELGVHVAEVSIHPRFPGTVVARRGAAIADPRRFPVLRLTDRWVFASTCRR